MLANRRSRETGLVSFSLTISFLFPIVQEMFKSLSHILLLLESAVRLLIISMWALGEFHDKRTKRTNLSVSATGSKRKFDLHLKATKQVTICDYLCINP